MTAYELMAANKGVLKLLSEVSVDIADLKYVDLYKEYMRLSKEGHKKTYIIQYLSDEYCVGQATVYRIIDKLSTEVKI